MSEVRWVDNVGKLLIEHVDVFADGVKIGRLDKSNYGSCPTFGLPPSGAFPVADLFKDVEIELEYGEPNPPFVAPSTATRVPDNRGTRRAAARRERRERSDEARKTDRAVTREAAGRQRSPPSFPDRRKRRPTGLLPS